MAKITREKFKVYNNVFDKSTLETLFKLSTRGYFSELHAQISLGKEANVFSAKTADGDYIIVKIYRVENCNFNKMYDYIKQDPRFIGLKKQRRKIIFSWVQREYRNLMNARAAGVVVPTPIAVMDNVLLLEYIGNRETDPPEVAVQLKNSELKNLKTFYKNVVDSMKKLHKIGLVHADLSAFNILDKDGIPYFIDFSQGTTTESRDYKEFLKRDIRNISNFFNRRGLKTKYEEIYKKITGKDENFDS